MAPRRQPDGSDEGAPSIVGSGYRSVLKLDVEKCPTRQSCNLGSFSFSAGKHCGRPKGRRTESLPPGSYSTAAMWGGGRGKVACTSPRSFQAARDICSCLTDLTKKASCMLEWPCLVRRQDAAPRVGSWMLTRSRRPGRLRSCLVLMPIRERPTTHTCVTVSATVMTALPCWRQHLSPSSFLGSCTLFGSGPGSQERGK